MSAYQVKIDTITVGASKYHICSLTDRQQYDDVGGLAALADISSATWALFGTVWPSSIMLAEVMVIIIDPNHRQQKQFSQKMLALGFACLTEKIYSPRAIALNYKGKKLTYTRQITVSTL